MIGETERLERQVKRLERLVYDLLATMSQIVQSRDPNIGGHDIGVAHLARGIAAEMGLSPDEVEAVSMAGILHDIGNYAVPDEVLSSTERLSEEEFEQLKAHPLLGWEVLSHVDFDWPIAEAVRQHHERLDGSGYPLGLSGDEICLSARILAVADVVESMSCDRPYREAPGIEKALEEVTSHPELYDARVAEACVKLYRK